MSAIWSGDLVEFLRARIDEDERIARGADAGHGPWCGETSDAVGAWNVYDDQWTVAAVTLYGHNKPYRVTLMRYARPIATLQPMTR